MRKEQIETGKNVEDAIEAACGKLGCSRDECEWEIIELPKKSFLGLKTVPAKVKVWIDIPEETPAPQPKAPVVPPRPKEKPVQAAPAPVSRPLPKPKPADPAPKPRTAWEASKEPTQSVAPGENHRAKMELTKEYVQSILTAMGLTAELTVRYEEGGACLNIEGQGLGMIIGRRGETLDAIQYLASLVGNRLEGDYLRVTVDCGDYRAKRKETLEALAKKLAGQVLKTNVSKTLEPMNPFERRIIHATVSEIEGVSSTSIGEEPNRRVVITSPTARSRSNSGPRRRDGDRRDSGGRDRRNSPYGARRDDRRGDRDRRPSPPPPRPATPAVPPPPKKTPEAEVSGEAALYSKIDLE